MPNFEKLAKIGEFKVIPGYEELNYIECSKYKLVSTWKFYVPEHIEFDTERFQALKAAGVHPNFEYLEWDSNSRALTVKRGWDFDPSGPTIDTKSGIFGSCPHDVYYFLIRHGIIAMGYRKKCDKQMYLFMRFGNMTAFRARIWLIGLKNFAKWAAKKSKINKIKIAP